jgi:hypothetical protein
MNLLNILSDIRTAINTIAGNPAGPADMSGVESQLSQIEDAIRSIPDCGCPDNTPPNYPPLDPDGQIEPVDFPDLEDADPLPTGGANACRGAYALADNLALVLSDFRLLVNIGTVSGLAVFPVLLSAGKASGGAALFFAGAGWVLVVAVVAALLLIISVFGWSAYNALTSASDDLTARPDVFVCAFLAANGDVGSMTQNAKDAIDTEFPHWNGALKALVKQLIWLEKVESYYTGYAYEDRDGDFIATAIDGWTNFPSACDCEDYDLHWYDLLGYAPNRILDDCDHETFIQWRFGHPSTIGDQIPANRRIKYGRRCDGSYPGVYGHFNDALSGIRLHSGSGNRVNGYFELTTATTYTLTIRLARNSASWQEATIVLEKWDGTTYVEEGVIRAGGTIASGLGTEEQHILENLAAGQYRVSAWGRVVSGGQSDNTMLAYARLTSGS